MIDQKQTPKTSPTTHPGMLGRLPVAALAMLIGTGWWTSIAQAAATAFPPPAQVPGNQGCFLIQGHATSVVKPPESALVHTPEQNE